MHGASEMQERATSEVLMHAASLEGGGQARLICPACGGGATREQSLSITVEPSGPTYWKCFRAACGFSGARGNRTLYVQGEATQKRKSRVRPFRGELRQPSAEEYAVMLEAHGLVQETLQREGVLWSPEFNRAAFPMRGPMGTRRGWLLRSYHGGTPKALTFSDAEGPRASYYRYHADGPILAVEDASSAIRVSPYANAVALLGTHINAEQAHEIASVSTNVVWCLDRDALAQALKNHEKYRILFDSSSVYSMPDEDFKDMPPAMLAVHAAEAVATGSYIRE